jgi:hypothetical protein
MGPSDAQNIVFKSKTKSACSVRMQLGGQGIRRQATLCEMAY